MSKQLRLDVAQLTDVGRKRPHNEDNMAYVIPKDEQVMAKKGALFIVADGMGGHAAGEVASEIAVDTVTNAYYQDDTEDIPPSLVNAIRRANALIHQRAAENMLRSGMGTTCVSAVLRGNMAHVANVGDSRAYMVRNGQVRQISQDHSWVEEQVRAGLLTKEQARSHAQRNVITRSLGTQSEVDIDIFSEVLEEGDSLILCTDGLSGSINEEDILAVVNQYMPQESVYHLVERANQNGGPDNITAIVVRVQEVGWEPPNMRYPVHAGSGRDGEDTAVLSMMPGSSVGMPARVEDGRVNSGLLPGMGSTPFFPSASNIAPVQAVEMPKRKKHSRLLYPTLAILMLLVIAVAGGAGYYFLRSPSVDSVLNDASSQISLAQQNQKQNNPSESLQRLAQAQKDLHSLQSSTLSGSQASQFSTLQGKFTTSFKSVLSSYNQQGMIVTLPCSNGAPQQNTINTTVNNNTIKLTNSASIQAENSVYTYMLGSDDNIYQLTSDQHLTNQKPLGSHVVTLSSDAQHIFALTMTTQQGTTPTYTLHALTPNKDGTLNDATTMLKDQWIKSGLTPKIITAWQNDVYVLYAAKTPNQAAITSYNTDNLNNTTDPVTISVSVNLISAAALPNKQLALLLSNGNVQSLQLGGSNNNPVSVTSKSTINVPLATSAQNFSWTTSIATPVPQSAQFVTIPGATTVGSAFLVSGGVTNNNTTVPHLFVVDNVSHRIVDLLISSSASSNSSGTVTAGSTPAATATAATGGGVVDGGNNAGVTAQLVRQYASPHILASVNSMVVDPKGAQLALLTQPVTGQPTEMLLDASPNGSCNPG